MGRKNEKETKKVFKWFLSIMKERAWLEEKSREGWFLKDISLGVCFTLEKGEPAHMVYDVEFFNLPKSPARQEIEDKTNMMEMAEEMGWRVVCHDESMSYYLVKPWAEEEANELYDNAEERERRGERYRRFFWGKVRFILAIDIFMLLLGVLFWFIPDKSASGWFSNFVMIYTAVCLGMGLLFMQWGDFYAGELRMSLDEWRACCGKEETVTRWKICLTIHGLERYLEKKAAEGYFVQTARIFRFTFHKGEPEPFRYMMDTQYLTNRRRKQAGAGVFKDSRDWELRNNDWQVQSLKDAEAAGWEFVNAVESRNVLYRAGRESGARALNRTTGIRFTSAFGGLAVFIGMAGLIGGIIGGLIGFFFG